MSLRSHALSFTPGAHGRSTSCGNTASHRTHRVSTHPRHVPTLAVLSVTEVQSARPEIPVGSQHAGGVAKLGKSKVSRLEVPFELTGRTGALHVQQEELQRHITTLGRELRWEKVQNLMKPAAQGLPATAGIFASAVIAMTKSKQWSLALELQQQADKEGFVLGEGTRSAILDTLGTCGKWEECLKLLREMRADGLEPTWRSVNATVNALREANEWKQALRVLDELRNTDRGPDSFCFGAVIETCGNSGKWQTCLDLLQEMREKGMPTASVNYSVVLRACGNQGQWRAAVKLVEDMRADGLQVSSYSYTAVISACGRARQWKKAGKYLKEAEASGEVHETTYNTLLSAYGRSGQVDKALQLVRAMKEKLPLGLVSYNVAITAFGHSKQPERAMAFYSEMKENGVKPDYLTFTGLITAFARVGKWLQAMEILDSMQSEGLEPNEITYSAAFSALAMAGHQKSAVAAHQLFAQMRSRGVVGNDRCYSKAIAACGNGGEWELAMDIFKEIEDHKVSCGAQCYEAAIAACSKAKKWEYATDLFRKAEEKFDNNAATLQPMYLLLMVTCIRSNQWPVAEAFLDVTEEAGYPANEEFWTRTLAASAKADRPDAVIGLLERIRVKDLSVGVVTYNVAIVALGKFGLWELALKVLDERGDMADIVAYNSALHALAKAGQWEQAVVLLDRMEAVGGGAKPDVISYTTVMGGLRRAGECQHVLDLLKVMPTKGVTPNNYTYRAALLACAQAGRRRDTLDMLDDMVVRGIAVTERCIRSALKACAVGGSWEVAVALLNKVENTGRGVRVDWIPDKTIYLAVLKTCTTAGQPREALAIVERMQARRFDVGAEEMKTLLVMCAGKSAWGTAEKALDTMRAETKVAMTLALTPLVQERCHKKQWGRLSDLLLWMKTQDFTPDQALLRSVQDSFRTTSHWREVTTLVSSWRRELD